MICKNCGREIAEDEPYAVLWGPAGQPASIIGFLCMPCSGEFKDITTEVTGATKIS